MSDTPFSDEAADRLTRSLANLNRSGLHEFAVTGGVAIALYLAKVNSRASERRLNDLDIVIENATAIPAKLADNFLISHVHLDARLGRMLLQIVDPNTALRIDIFGIYGDTLARSEAVEFREGHIRLVSLDDLLARLTRLLLDLAAGLREFDSDLFRRAPSRRMARSSSAMAS